MLALRRERLRRGWSQAEVSKRTGITQSTVSKIETGVWPVVYPSWALRLSRLFKMSVAELLEEVGADEPNSSPERRGAGDLGEGGDGRWPGRGP